MTRLRLDQLPADVRARIAAGEPVEQRRRPRSRAQAQGDGLPLTCVGPNGCGEIIERPTDGALARHMERKHGNGSCRFEYRHPHPQVG